METLTKLDQVCDDTTTALAAPGDWLDGAARIAVWEQARDAQTNELDRQRRQALSPAAVNATHPAAGPLSSQANEVVHRIASDPGRLSERWAHDAIEHLEHGERTYTELVGVTAITRAIDRFDRALGRKPRTIPQPKLGDPSQVTPDDVGNVGAWVSQRINKERANVSRALSLVPVTDQTWRHMVNEFYSHGEAFFDLAWDRPLSRAQTELVAARTTLLNQCFY